MDSGLQNLSQASSRLELDEGKRRSTRLVNGPAQDFQEPPTSPVSIIDDEASNARHQLMITKASSFNTEGDHALAEYLAEMQTNLETAKRKIKCFETQTAELRQENKKLTTERDRFQNLARSLQIDTSSKKETRGILKLI